ncbi:MAG: VanW family protein [Patescibacteria group bacterium]
MSRTALSKQFPVLAPLIKETKISLKSAQTITPNYAVKKDSTITKVHRIYKHKSVLRRKLGDSDPVLQERKVYNLGIAAEAFDGIVIKPGQTFSFWRVLKRPTYKRGFVDGMLISDGKAVSGLGGGLCQMANLLYWMFLHSPLEIVEHHHHSVDLFPDSGRVLPFGSGASVFYNYIDLQIKNTTSQNIILHTSLDDAFLHGSIWMDDVHPFSYSVKEEEHYFYKKGDQVYRTNKLYKVTRQEPGGIEIAKELITHNDSKVLYEVEPEKLTYILD